MSKRDFFAVLREKGIAVSGGGETPPAPPHVAATFSPSELPNPGRLVPTAVTSRAAYDLEQSPQGGPAIIRMTVCPEEMVGMLTSCLDSAPCRESARVIYRALYRLALDAASQAGHAASTTRAVFHLVAELLMSYCGLKKSAFYENLGYLTTAGLVDCEAHMGNLRGKSVATGTLWAVSLHPERVLSGQASPVRLLGDDWAYEWRNLNADVKCGRTAYNELHPRPVGPEGIAGESTDRAERRMCFEDLQRWTKKPLVNIPNDNLTLRHFPEAGQNVVWELDHASKVQARDRASIIDRQARTLAAAFGDPNLEFWRRFIWNLTRGIDAGTDMAAEAGTILARILSDLRTDIKNGGTPPKKPASVANKALADIQAALRVFQNNRVGVRPELAA